MFCVAFWIRREGRLVFEGDDGTLAFRERLHFFACDEDGRVAADATDTFALFAPGRRHPRFCIPVRIRRRPLCLRRSRRVYRLCEYELAGPRAFHGRLRLHEEAGEDVIVGGVEEAGVDEGFGEGFEEGEVGLEVG